MLRLTTSRATEKGRLYANHCLIDQFQKVAPSVQALGAFVVRRETDRTWRPFVHS